VDLALEKGEILGGQLGVDFLLGYAPLTLQAGEVVDDSPEDRSLDGRLRHGSAPPGLLPRPSLIGV
jgi:hypothetical protein